MAVDASPGAGRVLIASSGGPLTAEPSWARYDNLSACRCGGFDWNRGRQDELDVTNTGTARVFFHDRNGTFDDESWIGKQIMLQLLNPVTSAWQPVFRGHIDDISSDPSPEAPALTNSEVQCVGIFDYLAGVKMVPDGSFGDPIPATADIQNATFYEDNPVNTRIVALLDDAGLDADMYVVFTGNVDVNETIYDGDDILSAIRDATDAEFPSGVANAYEDRWGRVVWHGRRARFDPDGTSEGAEWTFTRWSAGTREDVVSGVAQVRDFTYNRPRSRIINSYLAWPGADELGYEFKQRKIAALTRQDAGSISSYGIRSVEEPSLIIKEHKTNGNTGAEECGLFGDYYVANYSDPKKNVQRLTFKSVHPDDNTANKATDVWAIMGQGDVSDVVQLFIDEAGLAGDEFFIEGMQGECRVGSADVDHVIVTFNLSPASYYATDPFDD